MITIHSCLDAIAIAVFANVLRCDCIAAIKVGRMKAGIVLRPTGIPFGPQRADKYGKVGSEVCGGPGC